MSIAKSVILNLSRSNVSRVCFSTAFRHPGDIKDRAAENATAMKDKASEAACETQDMAKQKGHEIKGTAEQMVDKTKQYASDAAEKTKNAAGTAAEKTKQAAHDMRQKAVETTMRVRDNMTGAEEDMDVNKFVEDHIKRPAREHNGNA